MRIAVGGIEHETNTFAVGCFGLTELDDFHHYRGDRLIRTAETRTATGGIIHEALERGHDVVPTYYAMATPSGTISASAYQTMKAELVDRLTEAMPLDAVALAIHGAGVAEGIDDLEADLASAVRLAVGDGVAVGATLDLHGNLTQPMGDSLDLMFGCHYYPHVDMYERGEELVGALEDMVNGKFSPVNHIERLPFLTPTSGTAQPPAGLTNERCAEAERLDGVIDCTFFHGFAHTDCGPAGASITVTTNGDAELAARVARDVALDVWARRESFTVEAVSEHSALTIAKRIIEEKGGPVVMNDTADNPGGGAPGDATHLLRSILDANPERTCFGFVYDAATATAAHEAGVGAVINISLGGHHDAMHGEPIETEAYVKALTDGRFIYTSKMLEGVPANLGLSARLVIGNVDVIVTSVRDQTFDDEVFTLHGIDVTTYDLVAVKSSQHFRAGFTDLATEIVTADTPGLTSRTLDSFTYEHLDGPRYPLDPELSYP